MTQEYILDRLQRSLADDSANDTGAASRPKGENMPSPDDSHFLLPDGYFSSFSERLNGRIVSEVRGHASGLKPGKGFSSPSPIRIVLAVASAAAMLAVLVGTGFYFYNEQRAIDAKVESIMAYDEAIDNLIDFVDGQNIEEILADATFYE
ncbi:MAG: hypothetical protein ACI3Z7_01160 [Candidatus Aphodosoma sp.]